MPDKNKKKGGPKKSPIVVSDKNDPRYKAYKDSLNTYNYTVNKVKSIKNNPDISVQDLIEQTGHLKDFEYKDINTYKYPGKTNIKPEFYYGTENEGKPFLATIPIYKEPKQPVIITKPRKKLNPTSLEFQPYNLSDSIEASTDIRIPKRIPKKWDVTEKTNYPFNQGGGQREVKYTVDDPRLINQNEMGKGNTREINTKYALGGPLITSQKPMTQEDNRKTIGVQKPIKKIQKVSTSEPKDNGSLPPGDYYKVYYSDPRKASIENQDFEYVDNSGYKDLQRMTNYRIYQDGLNKNVAPIKMDNTLVQMAMGGNMNTNMKDNTLNSFNTGGTHSQNPNGGIPMGGNNTVEQGETKLDNFIYSNRINVNKDLISSFNLPPYIKDKSFADASTLIDNKFKDRNDKASSETKKTLLDRLSKAHEFTKMQESLKANSTQTPDLMNGEIPEDFEQPMFAGGELTTGAGMSTGQMAGIQGGMGALTGAINGDTRSVVTGGASAAADVFLPGSGAVAGALTGGIYDLVDNFAKKGEREEVMRNQNIAASSNFQNDFAMGGKMDNGGFFKKNYSTKEDDPSYQNIFPNPIINDSNNMQPVYDSTGKLTTMGTMNPGVSISNNELINPGFGTEGAFAKLNGQSSNNQFGKKTADWLGNNYGDIMRAAPIAANAYQLATLKKPDVESLNRLDQRFNPSYVDEKTVQNTLGNDYDNTVNALSSTTNGSAGTLRNNILGAGVNRSKAMSDAYMKVADVNRNTDAQAQQFNAGINQANLGQDNLEKDINARNQASYDNNKSKLISQLGTDIGSIGKEQVYNDIAKNTFGYTRNGKYWVKPDGTQITQEEFEVEADGLKTKTKTITTDNAYGGYLKHKK